VGAWVRERLHDFWLRQDFVEPASHARPQLLWPNHRNQRADGDEAAVARRQAGASPDVAEQDIVGELRKLRGN
jgi:hypothetical protein